MSSNDKGGEWQYGVLFNNGHVPEFNWGPNQLNLKSIVNAFICLDGEAILGKLMMSCPDQWFILVLQMTIAWETYEPARDLRRTHL